MRMFAFYQKLINSNWRFDESLGVCTKAERN